MDNKFEKHPAYKMEEEHPHPETPEELEEAKKLAGVSTEEKAMERHRAEEERLRRKEEGGEKDYHNPEDFRLYESKIGELEKAEKRRMGHSDEGKYIDLFIVTDDLRYLDKAINSLKNRIDSDERFKYYALSGEIVSLAIKLIEADKPEFIPKIIALENFCYSEKPSRQKIAESLLKQGFKEEAGRYLPKDIASLEEAFKKSDYRTAYIQGLIKEGKFEEARQVLIENKESSPELYLAAGKKLEDLKMLTTNDIFKLLKENKADIKEVGEVLREKIKSYLTKKDPSYYFLSELIRFSDSPEDREWVKRSFEELSTNLKEEKIAVGKIAYVDIEGNLFNLAQGLISLKLNSETETKIINFLEKIDFEEASEKKGADDLRTRILSDLADSVLPENKKITDFILKKSQLLGADFSEEMILRLGTNYQRERILDSWKRDIKNGISTYKARREARERESEEDRKMIEKAGGKEENLVKFLFRDYSQKRTENSYKKIKETVNELFFNNSGDATRILLGILIDQSVKKKNYEEAFKFLGDPELKVSFSRVKKESFLELFRYLVSNNEFEKAKELVKRIRFLHNEPIIQLIVEMYKRGKKEEIEDTLGSYAGEIGKEDIQGKENLIFNTYLELMKLTK